MNNNNKRSLRNKILFGLGMFVAQTAIGTVLQRGKDEEMLLKRLIISTSVGAASDLFLLPPALALLQFT